MGLQLFDQPLEGQLLVRERRQRRVAHAIDQVGRRRVARGVDTERERIDEKADQRLELGPGAVRDERPDAEIGLPRVARDQRGERGQQHLEECGRTAGAHGARAC